MENTIEQTTKHTLVLNEIEAKWLRSLVQNPLVPPDQEDELSKDMRQRVWDALTPLPQAVVSSSSF